MGSKWKIIEITGINKSTDLENLKNTLESNKEKIKPYIVRITYRRVEILTQPSKIALIENLLTNTSISFDIRDPLDTSHCNDPKEIQDLLSLERFYEAHICSEKLADPRLSTCLALYSALLVKISENNPRGIKHIARLLSENMCQYILDYTCINRLLHKFTRRALISGEDASRCLLIPE